MKKRLLAKRVVIVILGVFLLSLSNFLRIDKNINASNKKIDAYDQAEIIEEISKIASLEEIEIRNFEFSYKDVYSINNKWVGYVIDFNYDNGFGYAIFYKIDQKMILIELFFDHNSPYYNIKGIPIYFSLGQYFIKRNNSIYKIDDLKNKLNFDDYSNQNVFYGANGNKEKNNVSGEIKFEYNWGTIKKDEISNFHVKYATWDADNENIYKNNCANAAGVIMLNHWNKKYNNDLLKINYSNLENGNMNKIDAGNYMRDFYDYMDTNWIFGTGGTLPHNLYGGFERLIKEKGYKVKRKTNLNYDQMKNSIKEEIPVFIVSTDYYLSKYLPNAYYNSYYYDSNYELIIDYNRTRGLTNSHVLTAYGFFEYSLSKKMTRKIWSPTWLNPFRHVDEHYWETHYEKFLKVADGGDGSSCYYNYSRSTTFSNAAINVYK